VLQPFIPEKLPIANIDWASLIPLMSRASFAIARYDGMLTFLPNENALRNLLRTPLTMREATLSSRIEGTQVEVSEVLRSEAGEDPGDEAVRQDVEEVVNYRLALETAEREMVKRPFCLNLLLDVHRVLMTSVRGHNKAPGEFRRVQNYIGRPGATRAEAIFVPPSPDQMKRALGKWESYFHANEKNVLVQLAVVHAQFEILHPFLDGNGRIGRILIPLFLYSKGVLKSPTFYLSEYLEEHRSEYMRRLAALHMDKDGWTKWCAFFLEAVAVQSERNVERVAAILKLYEELRAAVRELTRSTFADVLVETMFETPIFQAGALLGEGMPQRVMLMKMLGALVEGGVLEILSEGRGRRAAVYSLHSLVTLCETAPRKIVRK
jgi:Fic family protein